MQIFSTTDLELYQKMIASAIENGLTFEAYDKAGNYCIKYTGGY